MAQSWNKYEVTNKYMFQLKQNLKSLYHKEGNVTGFGIERLNLPLDTKFKDYPRTITSTKPYTNQSWLPGM